MSETTIEVGSQVVGEHKGSLVTGEVTAINRGWATIQTKDGTEAKARVTTLELVDDEGEESEAGGSSMAQKLRKAKERYVKVDNTYHNGDQIAQRLHGFELPAVYDFAIDITGEPDLKGRYENLNPGQQRMVLGNKIRAAIKKDPELLDKLPQVAE